MNTGIRSVALSLLLGSAVVAQDAVTPTNDLPNPYQTVANSLKLPNGRTWGSTSAVEIDKDGKSIWVAERCGANTCAGSTLDPILKFDASGNLVKSFGSGMFIFPHGVLVDRDGNVWVTDAQGQNGKGHQVIKFSPDGKVLLTLGKAGVAGNPPEALTEPNDVAIGIDGDIWVAEGHSGQNANAQPGTVARLSRFSPDGKFIKSWGILGSEIGRFKTPHGIAFDSAGNLYICDRGNLRIQIFDKDGRYIDSWKQFGRPSGIYIDKHDMIYVADSESNPSNNPGWKRGMRVGTKDGKVLYFIPDPEANPTSTSAAEGVAVDAQGNIYGAEVGPKGVKKYVKKSGT